MTIKATNEEILAAYQATGSVWAAAKQLGMAGQTVWGRLRTLGHRLSQPRWTPAELAELRALVAHCTLGEIARRLGRSYASVATKVSQLGIGTRLGNRTTRWKIPRGAGLSRTAVATHLAALERSPLSARQYARQHGLSLELLVKAIQRDAPDRWHAYVATRSDLASRVCPSCDAEFIPMTTKQQACSRLCASRCRADRQYFGGKRRTAVGLDSGVCQLCEGTGKKGLSAHHVIGKEHDPDNGYLIALCPGCHKVVSLLAGMRLSEQATCWEHLITLVLARRLAGSADQRPDGAVAVRAIVELEHLTMADLLAEDPDLGVAAP